MLSLHVLKLIFLVRATQVLSERNLEKPPVDIPVKFPVNPVLAFRVVSKARYRPRPPFLKLFQNEFFLRAQDAFGSPVEGMASHLLDLSSQPLDLLCSARQIRQNPDRFMQQNGAKAFQLSPDIHSQGREFVG
jgi:hypothetical protein